MTDFETYVTAGSVWVSRIDGSVEAIKAVKNGVVFLEPLDNVERIISTEYFEANWSLIQPNLGDPLRECVPCGRKPADKHDGYMDLCSTCLTVALSNKRGVSVCS